VGPQAGITAGNTRAVTERKCAGTPVRALRVDKLTIAAMGSDSAAYLWWLQEIPELRMSRCSFEDISASTDCVFKVTFVGKKVLTPSGSRENGDGRSLVGGGFHACAGAADEKYSPNCARGHAASEFEFGCDRALAGTTTSNCAGLSRRRPATA